MRKAMQNTRSREQLGCFTTLSCDVAYIVYAKQGGKVNLPNSITINILKLSISAPISLV